MELQSLGLMKQKLHYNPFVFHLNEMTKACRRPDCRQRSKEYITPAETAREPALITPHEATVCHWTQVFYNRCDEITPNILPRGAAEKHPPFLLHYCLQRRAARGAERSAPAQNNISRLMICNPLHTQANRLWFLQKLLSALQTQAGGRMCSKYLADRFQLLLKQQ